MDDATFDPPGTLADAVEAALPGWVLHHVMQLAPHATTSSELGPTRDAAVTTPAIETRVIEPAIEAAARAAGVEAARDVGGRLRALLAQDVDEQRTNPLALLRTAARYPTELLATLGVPAVRRDEFDQRRFPDDRYGLGPLTWRDLGDDVHEAGIIWGAWKAKTVLDRRRAEGKR